MFVNWSADEKKLKLCSVWSFLEPIRNSHCSWIATIREVATIPFFIYFSLLFEFSYLFFYVLVYSPHYLQQCTTIGSYKSIFFPRLSSFFVKTAEKKLEIFSRFSIKNLIYPLILVQLSKKKAWDVKVFCYLRTT